MHLNIMNLFLILYYNFLLYFSLLPIFGYRFHHCLPIDLHLIHFHILLHLISFQNVLVLFHSIPLHHKLVQIVVADYFYIPIYAHLLHLLYFHFLLLSFVLAHLPILFCMFLLLLFSLLVALHFL